LVLYKRKQREQGQLPGGNCPALRMLPYKRNISATARTHSTKRSATAGKQSSSAVQLITPASMCHGGSGKQLTRCDTQWHQQASASGTYVPQKLGGSYCHCTASRARSVEVGVPLTASDPASGTVSTAADAGVGSQEDAEGQVHEEASAGQ